MNFELDFIFDFYFHKGGYVFACVFVYLSVCLPVCSIIQKLLTNFDGILGIGCVIDNSWLDFGVAPVMCCGSRNSLKEYLTIVTFTNVMKYLLQF